jgi:hypothetical protein
MNITHAVAYLHMGDEQTTMRFGMHGTITELVLGVGANAIARRHFRHTPPHALELENAIATVEDVVMPVVHRLPPDLVLHTYDAVVRALALRAGVPEGPRMELTIEALESSFNDLAAWAQGRPASQVGLPPDHGFAATLLILREVMHHLGFASIVWTPTSGGPASV